MGAFDDEDRDQAAEDFTRRDGPEQSSAEHDPEIYGEPETPANEQPQGGDQPAQQPQFQAPAIPEGMEDLYQRLPGGLKRQVEQGRMSPSAAINRHYTGFIRHVDQSRQQMLASNQRADRLERLLMKMGKDLGVDLEERAPAPPDPNVDPDGHLIHKIGGIEERLDRIMSAEESRQLDQHVDTLNHWLQGDVATVAAQEPEYEAAQDFVAQRVLAHHEQRAGEAYALQNWQHFRKDYLQAVYAGEMTPEELVRFTAIEAAMDAAASLQYQYFTRGGSMAAHTLETAYRLGWQPSRAQGGGQGGDHQPMQRQPNQRLERVRTNLQTNANPTPAEPTNNLGNGKITKEGIARLAKMTPREFDKFLASVNNPDELMQAMLESAAE